MKHSSISNRIAPVKTITVMTIIIGVIAFISSSFKGKESTVIAGYNDTEKDSIASVQAFMQVYKVLMSPRCMNCHPAGNRPLQGDDSHVHIMNVQRGKDGKGVYALKCSNCHQ